MKTMELVLPSGVFATILPFTWGDVAESSASSSVMMATNLAARTVLFDGERVTVAELMEMPAQDVMPVVSALNEELDKLF